MLQKMFHGVNEGRDTDHGELMVDVEDEEDEDEEIVEDAHEDSSDGEGMSDEDNTSTDSDAISACTSLETSDQAVHPRQENPIQVGTKQQMITDRPVHPPHPVSTFVDHQANGPYESSQALTLS